MFIHGFNVCDPLSPIRLTDIFHEQIPKSMTHYVENIGTEDVVLIEVLQADHFSGTSSSKPCPLSSNILPEIAE
jgi:hypothetical protein